MDEIAELHAQHVGDKYPLHVGRIKTSTGGNGKAHAWGCSVQGPPTTLITYADDHVRISYKMYFGTYRGDTDVFERRTVVVDGVVVFDEVE